ncbi:7TM diverse intracellular signaling domain-containing protein [Leptospira idonii]|nr:7TM diverse intracellular signaling domain-containing protein [Leptospira idonii]
MPSFFRSKSILTFLFFLNFASLWSQETSDLKSILLKPTETEYKIGGNVSIYVDADKSKTIEEISLLKESDFEIYKDLNLGFSQNAYWIRIVLMNESDLTKKWYLEVGHPVLDHVDLYIPRANGSYLVKKEGDSHLFRERAIKYRNFVFDLEASSLPNPKGKNVYFLRVESESTVSVPLTILSELSFTNQIVYEQFVFGIYYGLIFVMVLYNLFLFFAVRDLSYFFYVIYIACFGLLQMSLNGLAFQFVWPDSVWLASYAPTFLIPLLPITVLLFTRYFLLTSQNSPIIDKFLKFSLILGSILTVVSLFVKISTIISILAIYAMLNVPIVLGAAMNSLASGYRPAMYYLIAWLTLLTGGILYGLKSFGLLPAVFITNYGLQIGAALEVILLSFALASRINTIKQEKEEAQAKALEMQTLLTDSYKSINVKLEQIVEERTRDLNDSLKLMKADLAMAQKLQQRTLPKLDFEAKTLSIFTYYLPMAEIGGDFYDIHELAPGHFRFFLVDATGHGVQAALLTMAIKAEYESLKNIRSKPSHILEILNDECIRKYRSMNMIFSAILADIDLNEKTLSFSSAGHPPQIIRQSSVTSPLKAQGRIIGLKKDVSYQAVDVPISSGDRIFFFSDGVFEEFDQNRKEFGEERVFSCLSKNDPIDRVAEDLISEVKHYVGPRGLQDDLTLLTIEVN